MAVELALELAQHLQRSYQVEQFAWRQQERGVLRMAGLGLLRQKGLVDQDTSRRQRQQQVRHQWPVQIPGHEDEVVPGLPEVDVAGFEVGDPGLDGEAQAIGLILEAGEGVGVAVDRGDVEASRRQQQGVPAPPAGDVERPAAARNQVPALEQPGGRPRHRL